MHVYQQGKLQEKAEVKVFAATCISGQFVPVIAEGSGGHTYVA